MTVKQKIALGLERCHRCARWCGGREYDQIGPLCGQCAPPLKWNGKILTINPPTTGERRT